MATCVVRGSIVTYKSWIHNNVKMVVEKTFCARTGSAGIFVHKVLSERPECRLSHCTFVYLQSYSREHVFCGISDDYSQSSRTTM